MNVIAYTPTWVTYNSQYKPRPVPINQILNNGPKNWVSFLLCIFLCYWLSSFSKYFYGRWAIYPLRELLPINSKLSSQPFLPVNILISCLALAFQYCSASFLFLLLSLSHTTNCSNSCSLVGLINFNSLLSPFWTEITHLLYYIVQLLIVLLFI